MTRPTIALLCVLPGLSCSSPGAADGGSTAAADTGSTSLPTTGVTTVANETTSSGATSDTVADEGTTAGQTAGESTASTPTGCTSDDECPTNTLCDEATGTCRCDARVAMCLDTLPAGHWIEVPETALAGVFPPSRTVPGNPNAVVNAWSGGVYDRNRDRMVVWGGGHADYSGNEVYAFDLEALAWSRLNEPSLDVGGDEASGYYPDGLPRSRHTYDYLAFVPELDAMCSAGGAGLWMSGQINVPNFDCFDFGTLQWFARAPAPEGTIAGIADYDAQTGRVAYVLGGQLRYLAQYDQVSDAWTSHGNNFTNGGLGIRLTGRVHPTARRFVAVGNQAIYTWDLDAVGDITEVALTLDNPPPNFDRANPGLDYASALDRLVWWGGGPSLWSIDLDGGTWVEHPVAPTNAVVPPEPVANGTYGRFRYAIAKDLFVLVNESTDNVFVRRL